MVVGRGFGGGVGRIILGFRFEVFIYFVGDVFDGYVSYFFGVLVYEVSYVDYGRSSFYLVS